MTCWQRQVAGRMVDTSLAMVTGEKKAAIMAMKRADIMAATVHTDRKVLSVNSFN